MTLTFLTGFGRQRAIDHCLVGYDPAFKDMLDSKSAAKLGISKREYFRRKELADRACPAFPYPQETIFKPLSHMLATLDGPRAGISLNVTSEQCVSLPPSLHECGPAHGLFGYWNTRGFLSPDAATFRSPYFQYLVPGVYTLVVADAWGQALYAHFDVI